MQESNCTIGRFNLQIIYIPTCDCTSTRGGCGSGGRACRPLISGLTGRSPPVHMGKNAKMLPMAGSEWVVNERQKPCKALWMKTLYKCSHLPFSDFQLNKQKSIYNWQLKLQVKKLYILAANAIKALTVISRGQWLCAWGSVSDDKDGDGEKTREKEGEGVGWKRETSIFFVPPVVWGTCPVSDINKAKPSG